MKRLILWMLCVSCGWGQIVTTVAGTTWFFPTSVPAIYTALGSSYAVATDSNGNLYVSDDDESIVVKISPTGILTIVAGNGSYNVGGDGGPATSAGLSGHVTGLAVDKSGNLFISDQIAQRIRKVTPQGIITSVAGTNYGFGGDNGPAINASIGNPRGVATDAAGNLYIADSDNNRIRKVTPGGTITTVAGNGNFGYSGDGGAATAAALGRTLSVALDSAGNIYFTDTTLHVRKVTPTGTISTVAGTGAQGFAGDGGQAINAQFSALIDGLAVDLGGNLYIADGGNNRIRKVTPGGAISTVAGSAQVGFSGDEGGAALAALNLPISVALDPSGDLFIADFLNNRIREVTPNGIINTIAGTNPSSFAGDGGPGPSGNIHQPWGVAVDSFGNVFAADYFSNRVRKISTTGIITTIAGNGFSGYSGDGGPATAAEIWEPRRLITDPAGNVYVAEDGNQRIRKITPAGVITTVVGTGSGGFSGDGGLATNAQIGFVRGMLWDAAGNFWITDSGNHRIRKVTPNGIINTIAGNGNAGYSGDGGPATSAMLNHPNGIALDAAGNLFIADTNNARIRKVTPAGVISTIAGTGVEGFAGDGGPAVSALIDMPLDVIFDSVGNLYVADFINNRIRKIATDGTISSVAGNGSGNYSGDGGVPLNAGLTTTSLAIDSAGNLYTSDTANDRIRAVVRTTATFSVAPTSLSFSVPASGVAPSAQSVNLSSSITGVAFTASTSAPWMTVTPSSGSMPAILQVSVDPTQLKPGTTSGSITISVPFAKPQTSTIAVSVSVAAVTTGQLTIGPQNLSFSAIQNSAAQTRQFQVLNSGGGTLAFSVSTTSTGGSWLAVTPTSGSVTSASPASVTVTVTPGTLPVDTYQGSITVTPAGASAITLPVTLCISPSGATILVSQSGLAFTAVSQGGAPLAQSFGILNVGQGTLNWSVSVAPGASWLQVSPTSGTVTQPYLDVSTVNVSINPANLPSGTYYGQIQVASNGVANSPQLLTVVLTVLAPGTNPGPELQPAGLIFTGLPGSTPSSQNVMMGTPQAKSDSFQSGSIGPGFSYLPLNANVPPSQPTYLTVYPNFGNLPAGSVNHGGITLLFSDGTLRTVSVLNVVAPPDNDAPQGVGIKAHAVSCSSPNLEIQWQSPLQNYSAQLGSPMTMQVQVVDDCGNMLGPGSGGGATVQAAFSNNDPAVNLTHIGNGVWSGTWRPVAGSPGPITMTMTAFLFQANGKLEQGQKTILGSLSNGGTTPIVTANGVVQAASSVGGMPVAPGTLISLYGSNLSNATGQAQSLPLPPQLNGTQVKMGNSTLPLLYTSSGQLNVQVPYDVPVNNQFQIWVQRDAQISVPEQLVVTTAQPGIFTTNQGGTGQASIVNLANQLVDTSHPATAGDIIVIYCTGLGAVSPAVTAGQPASSVTLSNTVNPVTVVVGGVSTRASFAGLAPGYAGLYQVNVTMPSGVTPGNAVSVVLQVAGASSPATATIAVR